MRISGNKTNVDSSFRVARYAYCHFGRPGNSRHSPENIFLSGNSSLASRIGLLINCRWRVFVLHFRGPFVTNPIIPNRRKSLRPLNFNHSLTPSWHNLHSRIMARKRGSVIVWRSSSGAFRRHVGDHLAVSLSGDFWPFKNFDSTQMLWLGNLTFPKKVTTSLLKAPEIQKWQGYWKAKRENLYGVSGCWTCCEDT